MTSETSRQVRQAEFIKTIRRFFDAQGFHEIIAPVLNHAIPIEEHITPFTTVWKTIDGERHMYLPASPERALKLALANGVGNCYSIGHSFRNLEQVGPHHSPEFLMLEWYRADATAHDIMRDSQKLIRFLCHPERSAAESKDSFPRLSLLDLFLRHTGFDLRTGDLLTHMRQKGYQTAGATWHELFDQLFLNEIEPHLPKEPFFLVDFPKRISPLCKAKEHDPLIADRFELYFNGIEIGNGNTEETDSNLVRAEFERLSREKHMPIDEEFLSALDSLHGKSYAGIGIGVERLNLVLGTSEP